MKKADRIKNSKKRADQTKKYELQEEAMRTFFTECRLCMPKETWKRYYPEAEQQAGETFHVFEVMIYALAEAQIPITPPLRKAIDAVLQSCEIDRARMADLSQLNYDDYWKKKYGYR